MTVMQGDRSSPGPQIDFSVTDVRRFPAAVKITGNLTSLPDSPIFNEDIHVPDEEHTPDDA